MVLGMLLVSMRTFLKLDKRSKMAPLVEEFIGRIC